MYCIKKIWAFGKTNRLSECPYFCSKLNLLNIFFFVIAKSWNREGNFLLLGKLISFCISCLNVFPVCPFRIENATGRLCIGKETNIRSSRIWNLRQESSTLLSKAEYSNLFQFISFYQALSYSFHVVLFYKGVIPCFLKAPHL